MIVAGNEKEEFNNTPLGKGGDCMKRHSFVAWLAGILFSYFLFLILFYNGLKKTVGIIGLVATIVISIIYQANKNDK